MIFSRLAVATGAASVSFLATAAMAHHGWSWAEADQIELSGTVREVFVGPPHPAIQLETADGLWLVELGNPNQTKRAGFEEGSAKVGDRIVALGNRSEDRAEKRLKAVRLTVGEKAYDIYPERIKK